MPASRAVTAWLAAAVLLPVSCGSFGRVGPGAVPDAIPPTSYEAWVRSTPDAGPRALAQHLRRFPTGLLPAEIDHVARVIAQESRRAGLSPDLVLALIQVESSGRNFARSNKGALGLMQLRPPTARAVARRVGVPWRGRETLFDAGANVRLGIAYLRELIDRYDSVPIALAAYNWGPTRVSSMIRRGETLPAIYPNRVLSAFDQRIARRGA